MKYSGFGCSNTKVKKAKEMKSLSHSKQLKMSNNSGFAQSSMKLMSSTNEEEPLWTLSDEELTARKDLDIERFENLVDE